MMMVFGMFVFTLRTVPISSCATRRSGVTLKMTGLISRRVGSTSGPVTTRSRLTVCSIQKSPAGGGRCRRWRQSALPVAPGR
jgi:hypothetical protein